MSEEMKYELQNKIAVVTGGSRGIGLQIAQALHEVGAKVAITGQNSATLEQAAESVGENCYFFECDQRDFESIVQMVESVTKDVGVPDILVNNAGVMKFTPVQDMKLDLWNEVIETNLTGVFLTTQAFLPGMIKKDRGDIFMISSMSGKKGDPGTSAYNASKFGLQGFSQSLMYEVRKHNIRVMVLNPSSVDTGKDTTIEYGKGLHLHARDIADTVVHLACLPGRTMIRDMDIYGTNP